MIRGEVSRVNLAKKHENGNYVLHIDGRFEDTNQPFNGWLRSRYQPDVYERGKEDKVSPELADGMRFEGRAYVKCYAQENGYDRCFLGAVEIGEMRGEDRRVQGNPFNANPTTDDVRRVLGW